MQQLIDLFSKPPASFTWSKSEDGQRTIGVSAGFVIDIWSDRVEAVALFPPDQFGIAQRNGILLQLLLSALRPTWPDPGAWLAKQMQLSRLAAESVVPNDEQRVTWAWDRAHSRATLKVML